MNDIMLNNGCPVDVKVIRDHFPDVFIIFHLNALRSLVMAFRCHI